MGHWVLFVTQAGKDILKYFIISGLGKKKNTPMVCESCYDLGWCFQVPCLKGIILNKRNPVGILWLKACAKAQRALTGLGNS